MNTVCLYLYSTLSMYYVYITVS